RQLDGADDAGSEIDAETSEFTFEEAIVEARVVCDEELAGQALAQVVSERSEVGGAGDHLVVDAGQAGYERGYRHSGIDQGVPFASTMPVDLDESDLQHPVAREICAGCFEIDEDESLRNRDLHRGFAGGVHRNLS